MELLVCTGPWELRGWGLATPTPLHDEHLLYDLRSRQPTPSAQNHQTKDCLPCLRKVGLGRAPRNQKSMSYVPSTVAHILNMNMEGCLFAMAQQILCLCELAQVKFMSGKDVVDVHLGIQQHSDLQLSLHRSALRCFPWASFMCYNAIVWKVLPHAGILFLRTLHACWKFVASCLRHVRCLFCMQQSFPRCGAFAEFRYKHHGLLAEASCQFSCLRIWSVVWSCSDIQLGPRPQSFSWSVYHSSNRNILHFWNSAWVTWAAPPIHRCFPIENENLGRRIRYPATPFKKSASVRIPYAQGAGDDLGCKQQMMNATTGVRQQMRCGALFMPTVKKS